MAPKAPEQKPWPPPVVPHANGTAGTSRVASAPRVKRSSGGWLWSLVGLIIIAAVAAGVYYYYFMPKPGAAADGTATTGQGGRHGGKGKGDIIRVITATAAKGDIGVYLVGLGAVTPLNTVTVKTRVDGQLMKVNFTEGQMVKEGDLLVQLDARPYEATLAQNKAQEEHDEALLDNAKIDEARYETLWKQDSIPQQQLATQQALVKQDQGTVDLDNAQILATNLNITYCNITSPITGRVGLRLVDVGNQVHAADTNGLLVITQLQPITVIFTIPEDSVPEVMAKINADQQLPVEALDRAGKKELSTGSLLTRSDAATGTLKLKALFPNDDNSLFPNQFVNARLLVETKKDVVLIPVAAIQYGAQNSTYVYVVDTEDQKSGTVKMKTVVVGTTGSPGTPDSDKAEIVSGLSEGDVVVIDGVDKLQDGSKVLLSSPNGGHKTSGATADAAPSS
jgi:multidrug efflux system membrane fusion protein